MLKELYDKYPHLEGDAIDEIVIESKCNFSAADQLITERLIPNSPTDVNRKNSLNDWYDAVDTNIGVRPTREMKVYRLDAETPDPK